MIRNFFSGLIAVSVLFSACGKGREASVDKIKDIELRLENEKNPAQQGPLVYDLEILYNDFAERFPDDSLAPVFLYKAFEQNQKLGWYDRAIKSADLLISKFPKSDKAAEVLFNKAFIYDEKLNDDVKAGEIYREFIEKYPNHALAADAQYSITFLGMTPEEALRIVEEKHNQISADSTVTPTN
ncbi:MAG: tetratricopeptide repeat protein [Bacteroidia bacterium]|nr:tetratricopeptide repeat protein [Bacteroidia bacterium]